jgi:hypothetical protein
VANCIPLHLSSGLPRQIQAGDSIDPSFLWIPSVNNFRLTTESNNSLSASDRTSQSTLYLTPHVGNQIALYYSSAWQVFTTAQVSLTFSGLTNGKNYDVFAVKIGSGVQTILHDTFSDTNGTNLTAHAMNTGPGWTANNGRIDVNDNTASAPNAASASVYTANAGLSDVVMTCDLSAGSDNGLVFRYTDISNHFVLYLNKTSNQFELYEKVSGTYLLRTSIGVAWNAVTVYTFRVVLEGNSILCYGGGQSLTYSTANNATATRFGLYQNAGALAVYADNFKVETAVIIELSSAWTNDTTRATAITTQDGVWVKSGDPTRRLIGTIRATGTTTTEDSATKRLVANLYNRESRSLYLLEQTSHTYGTNTVRGWNGGTQQVEWVCPMSSWQLCVPAAFRVVGGASGQRAQTGFGVDSTSAIRAGAEVIHGGSAQHAGSVCYALPCTAGYHYIAVLERAIDASNVTFQQFEIDGYVMG